jgi:hypothetical protein
LALLTTTDGSTLVQGLVQDHRGYVGIGTEPTALTDKLQVKDGNIRLTDAYAINWDGNNILLHDGTNTKLGDGSASDTVTVTGGKVGIGTGSGALVETMEVTGTFSVHGNTLDPVAASPHGVKLSYSDGDTSGVIDTKGDHHLEFRTNNVEHFRLTDAGKLECGANHKPVVAYGQDNTESSLEVKVCPTTDHTKDLVLYSYNLGDIEEDDILTAITNWGVIHTLDYNPSIFYGLILADDATRGFGGTLETQHVLMMQPQQIHAIQGEQATYTSDLTPGQNFIASPQWHANAGDASTYEVSNAFDNDEATFFGGEWHSGQTSYVGYITVNFGSGNEKKITKFRVKPNISVDGFGGIKSYKIRASNDNSTWTDLVSALHDNSDNWQELTFNNSTAYRYYQLYVVSSYMTYGGYYYFGVFEMEMMENAGVAGTYTQAQSAAAMHKVTAANVTNTLSKVNFVVWAEHPDSAADCSDPVTVQINGQLDVMRVRGRLTN